MILITRPRYDEPTHYLFYWTENIIQKAKRLGLTVYDLSKERADLKTVESFLIKKSPRMAIFNGHGGDNVMLGHDNEVVVSFKNAKLLAGKNVYMRACNAGKFLGPEIVKKGANGFIGYKEPFMFPYDKGKVAKPLEDELAKPCMECSNQVGNSLIGELSVHEAHKQSLKKYLETIEKLSNIDMPPYVLTFLFWNMTNQVWYEAVAAE